MMLQVAVLCLFSFLIPLNEDTAVEFSTSVDRQLGCFQVLVAMNKTKYSCTCFFYVWYWGLNSGTIP
jgi:hypothetical protein